VYVLVYLFVLDDNIKNYAEPMGCSVQTCSSNDWCIGQLLTPAIHADATRFGSSLNDKKRLLTEPRTST